MHIPFCRQACTYCNFHFTTSLRYKDELVEALKEEIRLQKAFLDGEPVRTIYFGGGTPSLLEERELNGLLETIHGQFPVAAQPEITLEANPDDITPARLQEWKAGGINRLSIGIQSFFEEDLKWMNRAHHAGQAARCIEDSLEAGFQNFSIDLIYGTPFLTDEHWQQNVEKATGYGIPHLSCYALTVEEKTPLDKKIRLKESPDMDSDKQARQFLLLMKWLNEKGYEHYEVSNFARPGFRSGHNSSYWKGEKYLGIGPSAHSFNGTARQWNVAHNSKYIRALAGGTVPSEVEVLTPDQQLNEHLMISLRTREGLNLDRVEAHWGVQQASRIEKEIRKYVSTGLVLQEGKAYRLSREGMLRADGIAARLFV